MQVRKETIVNVLPGAEEERRLILAVEQIGTAGSALVLRQESYSEDVGWFVQSRIVVEPGQVAGLRTALTGGGTGAVQPRAGETQPMPTILRFARKEVAHQAG
jgi:hypothetical protein